MTTLRLFKMQSEIRGKGRSHLSVVIEPRQIDIIMYLG